MTFPTDVEPYLVARRPEVTSVAVPCAGRSRRLARPAAALALAAIAFAGCAQAARLVVVQANDTPRLARTLAALKAHAGMPVEVLRLDSERDAGTLATIERPPRGTVVIALGPRASDALRSMAPATPAVHCLAGADALRDGGPAVPSEAPADQQAAWLRKLVPAARNIAILYDPALNTRRAQAAAAAFDTAGYRVLLQPVAGPAALPSALSAIAGRADVLLALPDGTVYAAEAASGILLFSFRNGIPLIGPSEAWVRRGALFAVDWDYAEVGAACAKLALRELHSGKAAPVPMALRPQVLVNPKIASRFGLHWEPEQLGNASVHRE